MSSISLVASADSVLGSNERGCERSLSARSIRSAAASSPSIGLASPATDDVRSLRADRLRSDGISVDAICGGFPCQDVSISNVTGAGLDGERSGLWFEYARIIGELRPRVVIVENVAELLNRGMGRVLGALADLGYDAEWRVLRGLDVGLPFIRERVWIVAEPKCEGRQGRFQYLSSLGIEATPSAERRHQAIRARSELETHIRSLRVDDGLSVTMERRRLYGLGNAVVPQIPEIIGRAIMNAVTAGQAA